MRDQSVTPNGMPESFMAACTPHRTGALPSCSARAAAFPASCRTQPRASLARCYTAAAPCIRRGSKARPQAVPARSWSQLQPLQGNPDESLTAPEVDAERLGVDVLLAHKAEEAAVTAVAARVAQRQHVSFWHPRRRHVG